MRPQWAVTLISCALGIFSGLANAALSVIVDMPTGGSQDGTSAIAEVATHTTASPSTFYSVLTLGVGHTLNCQGGQNNPRPGDHVGTINNVAAGGTFGTLEVSDFAISGFNQWQVGVDHECTVNHRGRAAAGATGAAQSGVGYDFTLTGSGLEFAGDTDTTLFNMRRFAPGGGGGGGCTPGFHCCTP